jgi:predicted nuclease of restriction endonuclease-like (RecB) superfamily
MLNTQYNGLITEISTIFERARKKAYIQVNQLLVHAYWEIGKHIVEYEQQGNIKARYGKQLIDHLARDLKAKFGRGFSRSNLIYMRLFYIKYPKSETLSHQLSWSHYFELLKIDNKLEQRFYENQCISEKWSIREFKRQIKSALFERLSLSKDKKEILKLSYQGQIIETPQDIIKDEYCLEFLGIEPNINYLESNLETAIINNLEKFLLELGKGFAFVKRQFRIHINNKHFHVDLVFYHMILKCYILCDLKIDEVSHVDIGQMNFYVNFFNREEKHPGDNDTIGIVLSAKKDNVEIDYALGGITNKIFTSKYQLYLPNKQDLKRRIQEFAEQHLLYPSK